ncbi:GNAT family N-acetyltransferase [Pseudoclavibacter chungangensis]|uniref:GNAT family N-acetyltransferase n=1 Tax=Pseudoclavibacter chungangensis TaxID=587635 RepID=A0A7J5BPJ4_9MICO|nr:GNAT family N-acetyltransferase [Pseudoclavibacter chungangensis]KAB1655092.1 GNAT family N-acetyltransferase [Pseudoclavibacter chungangensis]NYJ66138.1 GNAT superfamily N-acetyltransferase [Pseudoclavibacter chungangensis]
MTNWRIRDFQPGDLDALLRLWDQHRATSTEPVYALGEVLASTRKDTAVVAVKGDDVVGVAVARAAHDQGWIVFLGTDVDHRRDGIGGALLQAIEQRMAPQGLQRLSILVPDEQTQVGALSKAGFADKRHLRFFEREIPVKQREILLLRELGGRVLPPDRWESIGGMQHEKDILERRLVLPLSDPQLAEHYGVVPPRAIVLFGPPGTGKTTFAKGIASRLGWPFVEVFPSRLAASSKGLAGELRETFEQVDGLDHVVVFIDEVEEIASHRGGEPPSPTQGVTNELLKIIPAFRERPGRLLICATNFIRALDQAFLRHGRFDYVIPIGLPDDAARRAIWQRYVPEAVADVVDVDALVSRTAGYSPADIEFAARKASQVALERAVAARDSDTDVPAGPNTDDFLAAIDATRTTVSAEVSREFDEDIVSIARV